MSLLISTEVRVHQLSGPGCHGVFDGYMKLWVINEVGGAHPPPPQKIAFVSDVCSFVRSSYWQSSFILYGSNLFVDTSGR